MTRLWRPAIGAMAVLALAACLARADVGFDRPGGDYDKFIVKTGDPAECAARCERDGRCHSWSFSYPRTEQVQAMCWLKKGVPARVKDACCVSGVRGAGVNEPISKDAEVGIDRSGGDYRNFETVPDNSGRCLREDLQGRAALPRLDLYAGGLSKYRRALLSQRQNPAAAASPVLHIRGHSLGHDPEKACPWT